MSLDFLILYEHTVREYESDLLLKLELERRGYTCEIRQLLDRKKLKYFTWKKPKVLVSSCMYDNEAINSHVYNNIGRCDKIVNLHWEQMLSDDQEEGNWFNMNGNAKQCVQTCWGEKTAKRLQAHGMAAKNTPVTGAVMMDFLRPEFAGYYKNKADLCAEFGLDPQKKLHLYISSFGYASMTDAEVKELSEMAGTDFTGFARTNRVSMDETLRWFDEYLGQHPEVELVYRRHPSEWKSEKLEALSQKRPNFHVIFAGSVKDWIVAADSISIWMSTAIAEVYMAGKSCHILRPVPIEHEYDPVIYKDAAYVTNYAAFEAAMAEEDPPFPIAKEMIEGYFDPSPTPAYQRMCDLLEEVYKNPPRDTPMGEGYTPHFNWLKFFALWGVHILHFFRLEPKKLFFFHKGLADFAQRIYGYVDKAWVTPAEVQRMEDKIRPYVNKAPSAQSSQQPPARANKHSHPLLRCLLFTLCLFVVLLYTEGVLQSKTGVCRDFYAEPSNTIDVVFLGSSKSNTAVNPTGMFTDCGFTSYVMYNWSQTPWAAYYYALEALREQSPQVFVIEANMFLYGIRDEQYTAGINSVSNANALSIPLSMNRLRLMFAMNRCQTDHPKLSTLSSIYSNHSNWKGFTPSDLLYFSHTGEHSVNKGFGPLYVTESFPSPSPSSDIPPNGDLYPACREYLDKILELAENREAAVVFAVYPDCEYTETDYAHLAWISAYCQSRNVPVFDFATPAHCEAVGLDHSTDMADYSHVNYLGAAKISSFLGKQLDELYTLPDHRSDDAFSLWHTDAAANLQDEQVMLIKISSRLDQLLSNAMDDRFITFVYAIGDMTAADPGTLPDLFTELGMEPSVFDQTDASFLWVWQNGAVTCLPVYTGQTENGLSLQAAPGTVTVGDAEQSYARPGINAVVLDRLTGDWIQTITWSTEHHYASYTR